MSACNNLYNYRGLFVPDINPDEKKHLRTCQFSHNRWNVINETLQKNHQRIRTLFKGALLFLGLALVNFSGYSNPRLVLLRGSFLKTGICSLTASLGFAALGLYKYIPKSQFHQIPSTPGQYFCQTGYSHYQADLSKNPCQKFECGHDASKILEEFTSKIEALQRGKKNITKDDFQYGLVKLYKKLELFFNEQRKVTLDKKLDEKLPTNFHNLIMIRLGNCEEKISVENKANFHEALKEVRKLQESTPVLLSKDDPDFFVNETNKALFEEVRDQDPELSLANLESFLKKEACHRWEPFI